MPTSPESRIDGLDQRAEQRLSWLMFARVALALSSLAIAMGLDALGRSLGPVAREGIYWTVGAAFLATAVSRAVFPRVRSAGRFAGIQLAVDVVLVTALVHFSGGRESVFAFLYVCVAVYGAVLGDRKGAFGAATLCAAAYGGVLVAEHLGFAVTESGAEREPMSMLLAVWAVQVAALFLVGALASALAGELHRTGEALHHRTHALHRLRDLHQQIFESIMSGLLTTDSEYRITSFNPEAERISGYRAAEVTGRMLDEVIPGARAVLEREATSRRRRDGSRRRLLFRDRHGNERHLGLAGSPLGGGNAEPSGSVLIFQDVTRVVEMERELRRSERLAAVGELGAKIAHEIRNPLAAISGSIQMLGGGQRAAGTDPGGERERLMGIVMRETERLDGLITDFLSYARPRSPEFSRVDMGPLLQDLVKMIEASRPAGIALDCRVEGEVVAWADADQLKQALWNLGVNAVQAMPEGGRLTLTAGCRPGRAQDAADACRNGDFEPGAAGADAPAPFASGVVEIGVRDEGAGISPEVQERMFEPFFTTKPDGTGLGLATVHRIVESHGGVLQIDSRPGSGTTFRILLSAAGGER